MVMRSQYNINQIFLNSPVLRGLSIWKVPAMDHFYSCTNTVSANLPMVIMAMSSLNSCAKIFASSRSQCKVLYLLARTSNRIENYSLWMRHFFSIDFLPNIMWIDSILFSVSPVFSCVEHRTQSGFSVSLSAASLAPYLMLCKW